MQTVSTPTQTAGHFWQWRQQSIHYVRAGQPQADKPPLLLIHGFGASTDHWRKNIQGLQDEFEVWAIDLLGFGRSTKPNWQYSGQLWQAQLSEFIATVIQQPVILVGNSLGGYAALCVAANCPEQARGLVLLNSAGPFSDSEISRKPTLLQKWVGNATQALFGQSWGSFLLFRYLRQKSVIRKNLYKVYLDPTAVTDRLVEEIYRPACDRGAYQVFASIFSAPSGEKVDGLLSRMSCPLLMLWGESDPWINAQARGAKFRQYYPHLTEHYLHAGHCPHDEVPEQVNSLIRDWVGSAL